MRLGNMLLIIAIILLIVWGGGLAFRIAGGLIHIVLLIALAILVVHFLRVGG